ncbi:unnamed protein product, partial [Brassica oleracea]
ETSSDLIRVGPIINMYGRHPLTGSLEINAAESITDDDRSRKMQELDRATLPPPLDATRRSWLLEPPQPKKKKYVDLGCILVSRKIFLWTLGAVLVTTLLAGSITMIVRHMPHHKPTEPKPDNYTVALRKALMFFNAQKSGKLPEHNNVTWRGDSCMQDGKDQTGGFYKDLVGGYYDAGDATKFNFPMSYAMTMLSWSVIEYSAKYKAAGELDHVKELIKWGTDYFLETFNSSADTIDVMVEQVGSGHDDHYCWMRPEDIDNERIVTPCYGSCSHLGAEMAAALASASIVFKDNRVYSQKLVHGAKTLYKYADFVKDKNSKNQSREFYKSSLFWDELLWGGAWLYYATGNVTYLDHVTSHDMARKAGAFWNSLDYGVSSWDNKLPGAQLLLMRLRLFMSPGFPYEDILSTFHNQTGVVIKMAEEENSLEYTPTWVVAFICFIIVLLSLLAERGLHHLGKYLKRRKQDALFEALQKLKEAELMLLGFISLLLTVSQTAIRHICVPPALVSNMFPCKKPLEEEHHAPETSHSLVFNTRHLLSTGASPDHCTTKGKVPLISVEALHHLHIFIFVLAVIHVIFCASTMVLGGARIQQWKRWEDNFRKIPSQKDASKPGHAHAHHAHAHAHALHELFNANHEFFKMHAGGFWRRSVVISWLRSFCKQFYGSVTKSEYIALRHGFIMTHCPTNPSFNFHKYMLRTVEMDFKKVVTISWYLWLFVVVFLLLNVGGWNTYFWLSFLPLILLLMVGAKLENIISSLAVDVCEKRNRGEQAVITPSDELFWFHRPEIVLQLVHFILFQNSFEIAFFFWILFTYGIHSCIMEKLGFLIPRLVMGVLVQVLCSYSTLPLYALVTQMGSKFKKGIFDELVHSTLEVWLSDTRNKGESTSEAHRMEIEPTIPESFNVQVNELMECDNP